MKRSENWCLSEQGTLFERSAEGVNELLWLNPRRVSSEVRGMYPLRVEILCRFDDLQQVNSGLRIVGSFFQLDSLLAAVSRVDDASRFLLYTATWESIVRERFLALRAVLRPTSIGLRVAVEPAWRSLVTLTAVAERYASPERAAAEPLQAQVASMWSECVA